MNVCYSALLFKNSSNTPGRAAGLFYAELNIVTEPWAQRSTIFFCLNMPHKTSYDIIIIGAGPAGLSAGRTLLKGRQHEVLLLDKVAPWDHPIQCAEGVGRLGFSEAGPINPSWIRHEIKTALFHAPGGATISYTDKHGGYIIDRALMQRDIAQELMRGGIATGFSSRVTSISPLCRGVRTVTTAEGESFSAPVVIDASGPTTCFCKDEPVASKPADLEPAYFVWVEGFGMTPDHIHIFAGQKIAPGGYAWVFPRGDGGANIGIVLGRAYIGKVNLRKLLDDFLANRFPSVRVMKRFAGSIPCGCKRRLPTGLPGLLKSGDAASTVNPISRAGITEAMLSGRLAGEAALAMAEQSDTKRQIALIRQYERQWLKMRGRRHQKLAKVKNSLRAIPDSDYDRGAEALGAIDPQDMTMSKIFRASMSRFPRLVWAMRHLM